MAKRLTSMTFIMALILGITACPSSKSNLEFKEESFSKTYQGCSAQLEDCTKVIMTYPRFLQAASPETKKKLNDIVKKMLLQPITETKATDLPGLAEELFKEYGQFKKEFPQTPQVWDVERNVSAKLVSPKILTLSMGQSTYLGGAHPNGLMLFTNLNPQSGKTLQLSDLLTPDYETKLSTIAETAFRKQQGLAPNADLDTAGYFFKDGKFKLNDNFLITKDGLKFLFNPYEVGPYVMGPIEFTIAYSALGDLVPSKSPLSNLLHK